ncbi:histidine decarboxylase isoform 2-T2 [Cochliomyia hominivorax]
MMIMPCCCSRTPGKEMVDYIADYLENIRDRRVFPDVKPGYMKNLLPDSAPIEGEQWDTIFSDVERVIMPGITHWQSPHMHAYFPALNSSPSLLGDMLADAINSLSFSWASSPACTELEIIVMNWLGKMINLPDDFLHLSNTSKGGGVVQTTASEATLVCLLAGRTRAIQRFHERRPGYQDAEINARLVAYCSDQAHSSVEKAALIGLVRMRFIEADENLSMRGQNLREAIEDDIRQGLVPFWVCATLGTTGSCSFDNLEEIGTVCREFNLWLHVDAAYAGSAFICPEFRTWLKGIERADSIAFNPSKWLMVHFDATALWVKDSTALHRTFNVEPLYLQHENSGVAVDFMHWQIPLSRRFRALKIWFVLRSFGIKGLQRHIREGVRMAQKFEALVLADHRFEIPFIFIGLVVFRIKGDNEITERLLKRLNHRGNLHCVPSFLKGKYVIRFTVTSTYTTVDDILKDWMEIKNSATAILDEMNITISNRVYLKDTKEKCEGFGSSLLLSNSPLSPKIVNGTFAALFDADEFLAKTYAGIRIAHQESPSMRRRVRGILMSGKQFSLDSHMDVVVQTSMNSHTTNSKMADSYGKTSTSGKTEEHDAIREDEESVEDCEMDWILNSALQLNPTNYLAILNNQQLTPIDIIHRQNNLSTFLKKYTTKYEVKNFTKSVNSVRTPLTQYQLYKCPQQTSIVQENQTNITTTKKLYPGKRYLNLDLTLHNDSIFTDSIYNLPTPKDEVIPIIITADTPTSNTKCIPVIEEPHKLHPPNSTVLVDASGDSNVNDLSDKPLACNSILIPIEEDTEESNDIEKSAKLKDLSKSETRKTNFKSSLKSSDDSQDDGASSNTNAKFERKSFEGVWNDIQDSNLIPNIENPLETKDSTRKVLEIALSNEEEFHDSEESCSELTLISNEHKYKLEDFMQLSHESNAQMPIFSFISNQNSSSDSQEKNESENETVTNINYFPIPIVYEDEGLTNEKSVENIANDKPDVTQFHYTFSEDSKSSSLAENYIQLPKSSRLQKDLFDADNVNKPPKSLTFTDFSILKELDPESRIQSSKSFTLLDAAITSTQDETQVHTNSNENTSSLNANDHRNYLVPDNLYSNQPPKSLTFTDFSIIKELAPESHVKPSKSLTILEDLAILTDLPKENCIQSPKSPTIFASCSNFKELTNENYFETLKSSTGRQTANAAAVGKLYKKNFMQPKIVNSKSKNNSSSSSSDEFLESFHQPLNDSGDSTSASSSSLDLM